MDQTVSDIDIDELWGDLDKLRVFISHRDSIKKPAQAFADSLEPYGLSCFVAHDMIEPSKQWVDEIMLALSSMEIFIALVSADFHDSPFTNQEVGYALARQNDVPIFPIILNNMTMKGFLLDFQAIKGVPWENKTVLEKLVRAIDSNVSGRRLTSALIKALVESQSFFSTKDRYERLISVATELSTSDIDVLVRGFRRNDQLHRCHWLNNGWEDKPSILKFLQTVTGRSFNVQGKKLTPLD